MTQLPRAIVVQSVIPTKVMTITRLIMIDPLLPHMHCLFTDEECSNCHAFVSARLTICFLYVPSCAGLERDKFDNKTVTFEEHIKVEHNMWHYLFFIVLVKVKDSTEYTGPESYVAEMIRVRLDYYA